MTDQIKTTIATDILARYAVIGDEITLVVDSNGNRETHKLKNVANLMTIVPAHELKLDTCGLTDVYCLTMPARDKQSGHQLLRVLNIGSFDWCVARLARLQLIALHGGVDKLCERCHNKPKDKGSLICYDCASMVNVQLLN